MAIDESEQLVFDTIKDDFNRKLQDVSQIEGKVSYLLTVNSILIGVITSTIGLSYLTSLPQQLHSWPPGLVLFILLLSMLMGIAVVFPRRDRTEIRIEGVLQAYAKGVTHESLIFEIGGTMAELSSNLRELINEKGISLQIAWILTVAALIIMALFIGLTEL